MQLLAGLARGAGRRWLLAEQAPRRFLVTTPPSAAGEPATASTPNAGAAGRRGKRPTFLRPKFLSQYQDRTPPFGFNGLGEFVFRRTYARQREDGSNETWRDTVQRVVEGTFSMQQRWFADRRLGFDMHAAQVRAERMYEQIFSMKFLPPGRGLWAMGSELTENPDNRLYAALNNCAFVSTDAMHSTTMPKSKPFCFLMDASMLGVGVGFDVNGALPPPEDGSRRRDPKRSGVMVPGPKPGRTPELHVIEDSRQGWVDSVGLLIDSYFDRTAPVAFDYSLIRPAGAPIKGFGGTTSGPQPLQSLHTDLRRILDANVGQPITVRAIVDMMNLIGKCVVSSNTRQSAEISFGPPDDEVYVNLKNYEANPDRASYGWTSNNSVFCDLGRDYTKLCARVMDNGEPGFAWLENMRSFGRMVDPKDHKDHRAAGGNPCLEQTLESFEVCCLVETFPNNHATLEEYLETLQSAYL